MTGKTEAAFRTIGELSAELGVPQHVLRYWETRFPQLRPLQRSGRRRYYRPTDVALVRRIHALLQQEGYTIRGVQKLLAGRSTPAHPEPPEHAGLPERVVDARAAMPAPEEAADLRPALIGIRDRLARALARDAAPAQS
ncbi:DNA-binding transcriptional MerR regulator [Sphingomonas zeicaulis]